MPSGAILGALVCPHLLASVQRRKTLLIIDACGIMAQAISSYANIYVFMVHRFIAGMVSGINSMLVPLILRECTPLLL